MVTFFRFYFSRFFEFRFHSLSHHLFECKSFSIEFNNDEPFSNQNFFIIKLKLMISDQTRLKASTRKKKKCSNFTRKKQTIRKLSYHQILNLELKFEMLCSIECDYSSFCLNLPRWFRSISTFLEGKENIFIEKQSKNPIDCRLMHSLRISVDLVFYIC